MNFGIALYAIILYGCMLGGEYFLASQRPFWPGLVLPGITFCLAMMNVIAYAGSGYGNIVTNFITSNVLTFLLLIVYFFQRSRIVKK